MYGNIGGIQRKRPQRGRKALDFGQVAAYGRQRDGFLGRSGGRRESGSKNGTGGGEGEAMNSAQR